MYDEETIILRDKIYIPAITLDESLVARKYVHYMYDHKTCNGCDNKPERHNYLCDQCPAFKGRVATCNRVLKNGIDYVGLPIGDRLKIEKKIGIDLDDYRIVDKRIRQKFRYPVRMVKSFSLRDYQEEAVDSWWDYKHGLIVAPPRSGKTPTMLALAVELGYRTIVLAHQHDFLNQFIEHIEDYTNLPRLEKKYGKKLYGFPKKPSDFAKYEICVCTYQQFITEGTGVRRLKAAVPHYGTLLIDEVHKANSNTFAKIVSRWPSRIKAGVTATDKRKDGREILVRELVGPVVARVEIPQLKPKIIVHKNDFVKTRSAYRGPGGFTYATRFLSRHDKRNEVILDYVLRDLHKGHCIVIPTLYREHVDYLVGAINDAAGSKVAEAFVGGGSKKNKELRAKILDRARSRKTKVVVGIRSLMQLGLNVPAWSALYYIMPMSNEPNWKQESSRILTPDDSGLKRTPIIRMFVDNHMGLALGCWANTYRQSLKFGHAPTSNARKLAEDLFEEHGRGRSAGYNPEDPYSGGNSRKSTPKARFNSDDPYAAAAPFRRDYGESPREKAKKLKDRANKNTPKGLFNR